MSLFEQCNQCNHFMWQCYLHPCWYFFLIFSSYFFGLGLHQAPLPSSELFHSTFLFYWRAGLHEGLVQRSFYFIFLVFHFIGEAVQAVSTQAAKFKAVPSSRSSPEASHTLKIQIQIQIKPRSNTKSHILTLHIYTHPHKHTYTTKTHT